jgi:uncharacterized protein (DUF952 family)
MSRAEIPGAIVHLCPLADWQEAQAAGEYRAASLQSEGFIHLSRPEQILWVANQFYPAQMGLALLWVKAAHLGQALRWEAVGEQVFPHLYGALPVQAVFGVVPFAPDPDGVFRKVTEPAA